MKAPKRIYVFTTNKNTHWAEIFDSEEAALKYWKGKPRSMQVWEFFREMAREIHTFETIEEYKEYEANSEQCLCGTIRGLGDDGQLMFAVYNLHGHKDKRTVICPDCLSFSKNGFTFEFDEFRIVCETEYDEDMTCVSARVKGIVIDVLFGDCNTVVSATISYNGTPATLQIDSAHNNDKELPDLKEWIWDVFSIANNINSNMHARSNRAEKNNGNRE